jgi:acetyltransferase
MLFGTGGTLVEVFKDRSLGLPPLTPNLARQLVESTKINEALKGVRGRMPVDLDALDALLVRFSQLIAEQRWIREIDINPLLASPDGLLALDARVVVYDKDIEKKDIPRLAIRPYPHKYVSQYRARSDQEFIIRPIRPADERKMVQFHESLSEESVYLRYFRQFHLSSRVTHDRLTRICFTDYDRTVALVAETEKKKIAGVARLNKIPGSSSGVLAMLINDEWQKIGLGSQMLSKILEVAEQEGLAEVKAYMLSENKGMHLLCERAGFKFDNKDELIKAVKNLR